MMRLIVAVLLIAMPAHGTERPLAAAVLTELNAARTAPGSYAKHLKQFRKRFDGNLFRPREAGVVIRTEEGTAAVDEAIRFLFKQKPLSPLRNLPGLEKAAADLVRDQAATGNVGHEGSRSGGTRERIERYVAWRERIGENISYGPDDARWVVISLIVDDGVPDRGHRRNIFAPGFGTAGVACGPHPRFRTACVIDFAGKSSTDRK